MVLVSRGKTHLHGITFEDPHSTCGVFNLSRFFIATRDDFFEKG